MSDNAAPTSNGPQKADGRIKPGEVRNPKGRPKGARHRLGEDFIQALQESFKAHGAETIEKVRKDRPHEYLKVVASILPKELNVRTEVMDEMSDDDLANALDAIRSTLLASAATQAGSRDEKASRH